MSNKANGADNQQATLRRISGKSSETIRQTPLLKNSKSIKAYFLGALHDGTFSSNKRFRIAQKCKNWLIILKELLKKIGYNSWIYREGKSRNIYVLETLADFLDFDFNPLRLKSKDEICAYIRGFFDAEGGIPHKKSYKFYIQLVQNNKTKLQKIKWLLKKFGIKTGKIHNPSRNVDPDYWRMYILSESHVKFIQEISTLHPVKVKIIQQRVKI